MRCIGSHSPGRTKAFVKKNVGVFVFCLFKKNTVLCAIMGLPEEHDLIASLKRGDEKAWRYLYERHYVVLCKIAYDFVSDSFWAESIVEDAIFHLWEIRKEVEIRESLRSYLVGAVRNRCLNHLHSAQNRCETCFSELPLETLDSSVFLRKSDEQPLGVLLEKELEEKIAKAVNAIAPDAQLVFRKSRFEHKKNEEIALELGISVNTVKYHLKRALATLREHLGDYLVLLPLLWGFN